ncbi:MAG: methionyl-tRNA formyltransferase [Candidatus Doudnabacteria bacterium]|nr:methionyl-tRNA formyltransferase [Candidatus Doudnabacteria bacterium]
MKIVFFGTANVALPVLEALKAQHEILAVVTTPDVRVGRKQILQESPVSALAKDLNLPLHKPEKVKNNSEFLETLKSLGADIFVVVAYGKILPLELINLPQLKTVNVHFSLLPKYRGSSPIQAALLNGDTETGTTIFVLDELVDHGPIIAQKTAVVGISDNYFTLSDSLARMSAGIINQTLADYASGKTTPLPQDESGVSLTKIISKADGKINWQKNAWDIYNQYRAFYIWPGIWCVYKGQNLKITSCVPKEQETGSSAPGTILEGGAVVCGENTILQIKSLQLAGKNETAISDFLNGYKDFVGSVLD